MHEKKSIEITETIKRVAVIMDTGIFFKGRKIFIETKEEKIVDAFNKYVERNFPNFNSLQ